MGVEAIPFNILKSSQGPMAGAIEFGSGGVASSDLVVRRGVVVGILSGCCCCGGCCGG